MIGNTFSWHRNTFAWEIEIHAPRIYAYMKDNYFDFSQAPLVYISYSTSMLEKYWPELITVIDGNEFKHNKHMQVIVIDQKFYGSLI